MPEWYPSITLITKDPVVEEFGSRYLDFGPVRAFKSVKKVNGRVRQACFCHERSYNRRMFALDGDLLELGLPVPDRSQPCAFCKITFALDLRIRTAERSYLKSPFIMKDVRDRKSF